MRAAALALAMIASGCRQTPAPPVAPATHAVAYRLAWDTAGVARDAGGAGWSVRNDLGYGVHASRGWVTSYSMELVECPRTAAAPVAPLANALSALLAAPAFAGHSAGTPNPAAIKPMQVESLTAPAEHEVGVVTLAPQRYCQLHYLVARAGHDAAGLPAELDMVDTTLHLEGTYRAADAAADTPFTVHTATAYGQLFPRAVDTADGDVTVVVRRRLARIFDGVDFARMPEKVVAQQILKAIVDPVEVAILPRDGG